MNIFFQMYQGSQSQALEDILSLYHKKGFALVHYIYFANLVSTGILGGKSHNTAFSQALESADFLLPDGIALRMYVKKWYARDLPNLNGTDFSDYFLKNLPVGNTEFVLYGGHKDVINKAKEYVSAFGHKVVSAQHGYAEFDESVLASLSPDTIHILLLGLGTPKQELFAENFRPIIQKYKLLVFTQGGTFDFWAGNEKRAPQCIQSLKLEWLWRFIFNPKKNFFKVLNSIKIFYYLRVKPK